MAGIGGPDVIQIPACGRPFKLGMLYDCCKDMLNPAITLCEENILMDDVEKQAKPNCETEIITTENINEKAALFGLNENMRLNIICGLLRVSGSAKYLDDRNVLFNQERATMRFKCTTSLEYLKMDHILKENIKPNIIESGAGTHVVSGILYGGQVFIVFSKSHNQHQPRKQVSNSLYDLINIIPKRTSSDDSLTKEQMALAHSLNVHLHGDVLPHTNPSTYSEVVQLYETLPDLCRKNAVPLTVWLFPLSIFEKKPSMVRQIDTYCVGSVQQVILELEHLNVKAKDMMTSTPGQCLQGFHEEIAQFSRIIDMYTSKLKTQVSVALPQIRKKMEEISVLDKIVINHNKSPFSSQRVATWMKHKEAEANILQDFSTKVLDLQYASKPGELETVCMDPANQDVICFLLYRQEENPLFLAMDTYLKHEKVENDKTNKGNEEDKHLFGKAAIPSLVRNARAFIKLYQSKKHPNSTKFIIAEKPVTSLCDIGASIYLFREGNLQGQQLDLSSQEKEETEINEKQCLSNVHEVKNDNFVKTNKISTDAVNVCVEKSKVDQTLLNQGLSVPSTQKLENDIPVTPSLEPNSILFDLKDAQSKQHATENRTSLLKQGLDTENKAPSQQPSILVSQIKHDRVILKLKAPDGAANVITEYEISYKNTDGTEIIMKTCTNIEMFDIPNLKPATKYDFKIRTINESGNYSPYAHCETPVYTLPTSPPGKPRLWKISDHTARLGWTKPLIIGTNVEITSYLILVCKNEQEGWLELKSSPANTEEEEIEVSLKPDYKFKVIADCSSYGRSEASPESDELLQHVFSSPKSAKPSIINTLNLDLALIKKGSPATYQILTYELFSDSYRKIRKIEIGQENRSTATKEKVIMLVGATGAGKTTFVNGIMNYILGISWNDPARLKLVIDTGSGKQANQAKSQTKWITSYTLHHQPNFNFPYTITLVDTPGFGDTDGIYKDKKIVEQIKYFFSGKATWGIDHIDAVGFVVQSALPRLTPSQKHIYESISSIFGRDIKGNIFLLLTFADNQRPPALDGLREANIPFEEQYFKFNNSALYAQNEHGCCSTGEEEENVSMRFNKMFWKMGFTSFKQFLDKVEDAETKSIALTSNTLQEREKLEICIVALKREIQHGLSKLAQLEKEQRVVNSHKKNIDRMESFQYTTDEDFFELVPSANGKFATICECCKRTCHFPCAFNDKSKIVTCAARTAFGACRVCQCDWKHHKLSQHIYVTTLRTVTKTSFDIIKRYLDEKDEVSSEKLINQLKADYENTQYKIFSLTEKIRFNLQQLDDIALKPNCLSTADYIDILIQSEEFEAKPGFAKRVEQLKEIKHYAETTCRAQYHYRRFPSYKKRY